MLEYSRSVQGKRAHEPKYGANVTLVVARRSEGRIYIVGDTKFTPEIAGGRSGQTQFIGGLKVILLHPGVAIAFAHNTESAKQAIEGIHSRGLNLFDKNTVLDYLLGHHQRSLQQGEHATVEFLVACELDCGTSELFVVKHGQIKWVDAGYIGSTTAYNSFLHHENQHATAVSTTSPVFVAMQALDRVIRDPSPALQFVDGFTIALRQSDDNGFAYVHRLTVEGWATPVRAGHMAPVTFGGAPAGANEWSIGSSPGDRFGVLTAYCHTGSFGIIYCPALSFAPRIVNNCTSKDLVNESLTEVNKIRTLLDPH